MGTVRPGATIRIPFSTFAAAGQSITMTNFAAADILVYKDGSTTERASTAGFTATTDFDTKTGKQLVVIDLSDNTTAGFWAAGSEYLVAIDSVTVDSLTVGTWVARFRIGYGHTLDTTIATLSSQTSFTLSAGPADNNALVGMWAVIHNVASAVQFSWVQITGYTGSTKTVTLAAGASFTAAAADNFCVIAPMPLQPTTGGRTLDVSATGEAGIDWANVGSPTTSLALTGTTIASTQKVDIETIKTQTVTCAAGVTVPALIASTTNITAGTITTVTTVTNQLTAAQIATGVWQDSTAGDFTTANSIGKSLYNAFTANTSVLTTASLVNAPTGGSAPTAAAIATAVWQDTTAGDFTVANSIGKSLYTSGVVPGGSGGLFIAGTNAATTANITGNITGNLSGSVGSIASGGIASTSFASDAITAAAVATGAIDADALATDAVTEIANGILDLTDGVESGLTVRGALRLDTAALCGKASGMATTTAVLRAAVSDTKARITATVDSDGNRTAVTTDAT